MANATRVPLDRLLEYKALRDKKWTYRAIGAHFNRTPGTIIKALKRIDESIGG